MKKNIICIALCALLLGTSVIIASATNGTTVAISSTTLPTVSTTTTTDEYEDESFVVYIPAITTTTTMSPEEVYESVYQGALVRHSGLISERNEYNESVANAQKGYDLSITTTFLCSVSGDINITLRNKDDGTEYPIVLNASDSYYHYREYPAGNYELINGYTTNPECKVDSVDFSLGKYEHIGVTVIVYNDENEYASVKQSEMAFYSEVAERIVISTTAVSVAESTTADTEETEKQSKLSFGLFLLCFGLFVTVVAVIAVYKIKKK